MERRRELGRRARALAAMAAFALASPAPTPTPPRAPVPAAALSVHWKSAVTSSEARPGDRLQVAELWIDGTRMRIEDRTPGSPPADALVTDAGVADLWHPGEKTGTRMTAGLARRSGRPWHDYALRLDEIRARGRIVGAEKLDGRLCDVVKVDGGAEGIATYWLARDIRDFPLRVVIDRPVAINPYKGTPLGRVKLDYRNTEVRIPSGLDPSRYAPPADVRFDDIDQIFLRGRPAPRPAAVTPGVR